jgi:hypothetical protein
MTGWRKDWPAITSGRDANSFHLIGGVTEDVK